jgi:Tfp pilus assembly protein PilO
VLSYPENQQGNSAHNSTKKQTDKEETAMSLDELYQACMQMKEDEEKSFEMDEAPSRNELDRLEGRVARARSDEGLAVSLLSNSTAVNVHCYQTGGGW